MCRDSDPNFKWPKFKLDDVPHPSREPLDTQETEPVIRLSDAMPHQRVRGLSNTDAAKILRRYAMECDDTALAESCRMGAKALERI